mmetsp:Transcript_31663/g.48435  ORF Transcript_31663/g.48435 Transcript_31663/m.48435 type:complete len:142 (+) Transcript_31663:522-947(+)
MVNSIQLLLTLKEEVPKLDVLFFAKAMLYSSIKQHDLKEQIQFMYAMAKLNLLVYFTPKYLDVISQQDREVERAFRKCLPLSYVIQHYYTTSILIDHRKPDHSEHYRRVASMTKKRVTNFAKYGDLLPNKETGIESPSITY